MRDRRAGAGTGVRAGCEDLLTPKTVVIIGAGPAGLTAAHELVTRGVPVTVLEQDGRVGGLARTEEDGGFRFDIGGHRFFTKVPVIERLWRDVLGPDFLKRPRMSRIYYRGRFFQYPLRPIDVARNLGIGTSVAVLASYAAARLRPIPNEVSFEDWIVNRFGRRLYEIFFKTYTEKVWGIPCSKIAAEWAAQRIRGLSLRSAVQSMFVKRRGAGAIKTLIDEFEYPRFGPGMMWERFAEIVRGHGSPVVLGARVTRLVRDETGITTVEYAVNGRTERLPAAHVISTMPVPALVAALDPAPPPHVREAAGRLSHRDFLTVALMIEQEDVFADNWIYIHDSAVRVGRIQNFKNWSPEMVPDPSWTCLGLEYFCTAGDDLWTMSDADLVALARKELAQIGLGDPSKVRRGVVVRAPKAYPVYDEGYAGAVRIVRDGLADVANLQLVGRNGMHKYNNQDHSMLTGILAARNILGERFDLWQVNVEEEYHEHAGAEAAHPEFGNAVKALASTQPRVPVRIASER
jgi:protoporphyrinogen oxidase